MIEIKIDDAGVTAAFNRLLQLGNDMSPAMRAIAGVLHDRAEQNFADESGPLGAWPAVKDKKRAGGQILQDTGRLANSITASSDADSATVGTNVLYAAIHQFGGKINKPAQSRLVRHRTDRKGNLLHSEHLGGKGLIFAKDSHKNAVARWFEQGAHDIDMPARPFLPVTPDGRLQDGVEDEIANVLRAAIGRAISG